MMIQKIVIAGAEQPDRDRLLQALTGANGVVVQTTFDPGRDDEAPGVVVCAVGPGEPIESLVQRLRAQHPWSRLLLSFEDGSHGDVLVAVRLGVEGVVDRQWSRSELIEAVEHVGRGEFFIPGRIARRLLASEPGPAAAPVSKYTLSSREMEVLLLIAEGDTNREIGDKLSISENTVRAHVRLIIQKLRVRNRAQAAAVAASGQLQAVVGENGPSR